MMFKIAAAATLMSIASLCTASDSNDLSGFWRNIDDRTGFAKGVVQITKEADGSYSGTIVKTLPRPDYTPKEFCQNCPAPYTNKPIIGLKVLNGLRVDLSNPSLFKDALILDPLSGKIYKAKARLSADGRRLSMRGYVGVSMLGRSQSWFREQ
jgi:uncharacterized protein (DUF2147 family)